MGRSSNPVESIVPIDVMNGSLEGKIAYLRANKIGHPRMKEALSSLLRLTTPGCGTDIVLLIGPTGAGKTATLETARTKILQRYERETAADPSCIPVVLMEAPASGVRAFSWRSFYCELGKQLKEPMLDRKRAAKIEVGRHLLESPRANVPVATLRDSVNDALKHRRTKVVLIDEGRHLITESPGETLDAHMNGIKSLANAKDRTLTLSGAYDLHKILDLNDQVNRRTTIIHLARYRMGVEADEEQWKKAISSLQIRVAIRNVPDLRGCSNILMETCVGCVGTLSDAYARTIAAAHEADGCWRDRYLEEALLSPKQSAGILRVVLEGEEDIAAATSGARKAGLLWNRAR